MCLFYESLMYATSVITIHYSRLFQSFHIVSSRPIGHWQWSEVTIINTTKCSLCTLTHTMFNELVVVPSHISRTTSTIYQRNNGRDENLLVNLFRILRRFFLHLYIIRFLPLSSSSPCPSPRIYAGYLRYEILAYKCFTVVCSAVCFPHS